MYKLHRILSLPVRLFTSAFLVLIILLAAGCSGKAGTKASLLSPYRMEIVQGNFISKEQAALVEVGMSRSQVRTIMGTPLLTDIFHTDRWDYVFSINRKGVEPLERRFTVFFEEDTVVRIEMPDDLLTEEEFVHYLEANKPDDRFKTPNLQATPEQLEAAAKAAQAYREREKLKGLEDEDSAKPAGYYPPLDVN